MLAATLVPGNRVADRQKKSRANTTALFRAQVNRDSQSASGITPHPSVLIIPHTIMPGSPLTERPHANHRRKAVSAQLVGFTV